MSRVLALVNRLAYLAYVTGRSEGAVLAPTRTWDKVSSRLGEQTNQGTIVTLVCDVECWSCRLALLRTTSDGQSILCTYDCVMFVVSRRSCFSTVRCSVVLRLGKAPSGPLDAGSEC